MKNPRIGKLVDKAKRFWNYCAHGVWSDTRPKFSVNLIKTLNITVNSFLNTDIQSQACALTFRTLLAVVPALAMVFAIGRGFGFQNLLQDELYSLFPGQREAINHALAFVDKYLDQASEGVFIGIGLIFLLYTILTLMRNIEASFNIIWNVRQGRTMWRQLTDYTAMLLILPILMICGTGFSMFLNSTLQRLLDFTFMTPIISKLFELGSFLFTCLFFSAVFMLFPNTKVRLRNALMAGLFTGIGFTILQWIFVTGQMYVARYNAIYGSFSFLPLFLLWLQLVWVICLSGSLICYASQNIFQFSFTEQINDISRDYNEKVTMAVAAAVTQRFLSKEPPLTQHELIETYNLPSRLLTNILNRLGDAGILSKVIIDDKHQIYGYQPAVDPDVLTVNYMRRRLNNIGSRDFIPDFKDNFPGVVGTIDKINHELIEDTREVKLADLKIQKIKKSNT